MQIFFCELPKAINLTDMQNFIERFLQTSALYPEKTALVCNEEKMTYAQLEQLSAKIASRLLRSGARKEKIYPIVLERSMEYIASIIGILRAGAAYSPLSTEYPKDRVAFIIKDSGADFAIDDSFLENIEDEKILSEFPEIHMEDAAIAIYTSGSTGNPKGIIHEALRRLTSRFRPTISSLRFGQAPRSIFSPRNSARIFCLSTRISTSTASRPRSSVRRCSNSFP